MLARTRQYIAYSRRRSSRLITERLSQTVHNFRKATFVSCLLCALPRSELNLHVIRHSSLMRSACRQTVILSVLVALMVNDHSAKHAGAIRSTSARYERDETGEIGVSSVFDIKWKTGVSDHRSRSAASS